MSKNKYTKKIMQRKLNENASFLNMLSQEYMGILMENNFDHKCEKVQEAVTKLDAHWRAHARSFIAFVPQLYKESNKRKNLTSAFIKLVHKVEGTGDKTINEVINKG